MNNHDIIIIGGGQSALSCAYFLQRKGLDYMILDDQAEAGGAWRNTWDSLTLFSPSEYSSLPGRMMPKSEGKFPSKNEVIAYLRDYENHYQIKIKRSVSVNEVSKTDTGFQLKTTEGSYQCRVLISATGTWKKPFVPTVPGSALFSGQQLHSANYRNATGFKDKKVLVVGSGNSGAQLLAEVSLVATAVWAVQHEPEFLPDEVDGRVLFDIASAKYHAMKEGKEFDESKYSLGKIVMVPPIVEARNRGVLKYRTTFSAFTEKGVIWADGTEEPFDVVIWCTGFGYATEHLKSLGIVDEGGRVETEETRAKAVQGLFLVGYGNWTGFASATLIGVGRSAKQTVEMAAAYLTKENL